MSESFILIGVNAMIAFQIGLEAGLPWAGVAFNFGIFLILLQRRGQRWHV